MGEDRVGDIDWTAAAKYMTGEATPSERAAFEDWMRVNPDAAQAVTAMIPYVRAGQARQPVDVDAAWQRLSRRIDEEPFSIHDGARREAPHRVRRLAIASAMAAAVIAAAIIIPLRLGSAPQVASTGVGESRSIQLRDGSRVILAPGTTLRARIGRADRTIELSGEALFTVAHEASRPFIVRANGTEVEDLGTVFAVRSLDERTDVAVTQGSVAVRGPAGGNRLVLRAGERGSVTDGVARRVGGSAATATAWTRGQLVFAAAPLSEVARELERWHAVSVRVDADIAARPLTAAFAGENIDQIARAIAGALDVDADRRGDTVTFSSK